VCEELLEVDDVFLVVFNEAFKCCLVAVLVLFPESDCFFAINAIEVASGDA